jgi:NAD(P)H-dependent flavin oxidoreductase YrpB (nitropropane dioxygenase family)
MPSVGLLDAEVPIVAAPMAGGPTTVDLAAAVTAAGGLAFLAAGYKTVEVLAGEVAALADRVGGRSFGVNLFVPSDSRIDAAAYRRYAEELQPEADVYGLRLPSTPTESDDAWRLKIDFLREHPVPLVSLTFGLPQPSDLADLHRAGIAVLATVTSVAEALAARDCGADGIVVQGRSAGGHSAIHDPTLPIPDIATAALVEQIAAVTTLPLVAGGGIDGPTGVRELLSAGATAVAVGTLLLLADEAGTSPTHRAALTNPAFERTVITHAFTGRPARGLHNGFIDRHQETAPLGYPAVHHLTRELRQAAAKAGDADRLHLWAGTGHRAARPATAAQIVHDLAAPL